MRRHARDVAAGAAAFATSLVLQLLLHGRHLDNQVVNGHSQPGDAIQYTDLARAWLDQGFAVAFADAFRVPGYPAFLALTTWLFPENGLQVARIVQVVAIAASCAIAYGSLRAYASLRWSLVGAVAIAGYLPLAFWGPILTAEALSIFTLSLVVFVLARRGRRGFRWVDLIAIGLLTTVLAYLKPNNIIILIPVLAFIAVATAWRHWERLLVVPAIVLVGLAPWIAFGSVSQGQFIPSSTTAGGITMYWGLGAVPSSGDNPLFDQLAFSIGVRDPDVAPLILREGTAAQVSSEYVSIALQTWKDHPLRQAQWSAVKVAHLSGFLPRGPRDIILAAVVILSLAASAVMWSRQRFRPWSVLVAGMYLMVVIQGIVFLGDQRYRATLFDYPALIGITLGASIVATRLRSRRSLQPSGRVADRVNRDDAVVDDFGDEWTRFTQEKLSTAERDELAHGYFAHLPWDLLPPDAHAVDVGCGSGRWADYVAPRVARLTCIDASERAVEVARRVLQRHPNVEVRVASVDAMAVPEKSVDLVYSLGVLHHVPDTQAAIDDCAALLAPRGYLYVYLYYSFENRRSWYRGLWRVSDTGRRVISSAPGPIKNAICEVIAVTAYWPLARTSRVLERLGVPVDNFPLASYRRLSLYSMRTDARDRFGTRLEKRFTRAQVAEMLTRAGLIDVEVPNAFPYWIGIGRKPS